MSREETDCWSLGKRGARSKTGHPLKPNSSPGPRLCTLHPHRVKILGTPAPLGLEARQPAGCSWTGVVFSSNPKAALQQPRSQDSPFIIHVFISSREGRGKKGSEEGDSWGHRGWDRTKFRTLKLRNFRKEEEESKGSRAQSQKCRQRHTSE